MQTKRLMDTWLATHEDVLNSLPRPSGGVRTEEASRALLIWDTELAQMHAAFARALERRNELAPISALPPELLAHIFSDLAGIWPANSYNDGPELSFPRGWTKVASVCRSWRAIAIECASLWATISVDGREPIDLFLARAKDCTLSVVGRLKKQVAREVSRVKRLLEYNDRLSRLEISIDDDYREAPNADTIVFHRLALQPHIKTLSVRNNDPFFGGSPWGPEDPAGNPTFGPPHVYISSLAKQLATVNLLGYVFPWGAGSPTLRSLNVSWARSFPPSGYSLIDVLGSLRAMPALEKLVLIGCLPNPPYTIERFIGEEAVVSLPRMQDMQLKGHNDACWVLWALTDINASAKVSVHSLGQQAVELVVSTLSRHMQSSPIEYTGLTLWQTSPRSLAVRLDRDTDYDDTVARSDLELSIKLNGEDNIPLRILRVVPLEPIKTLAIRGTCYTWSSDDLAPLFSTTRRLRCIKLQGTPAAKAFCSLLLPPSAPLSETMSHADLPVPGLTELQFDRVNLKALDTTHPVESDPSRLTLGGKLTTALGVREGSNSRLSRLFVKRSSVREEWVQTWKSVVDKLDWEEANDDEYTIEDQELSERGMDWTGYPGSLSEDELDFLGDDGQSGASFQWEHDGLSEVEDEDEDDEDNLDPEDWE